MAAAAAKKKWLQMGAVWHGVKSEELRTSERRSG